MEMTGDRWPSDVNHVEKITAVSQARGNTGGASPVPSKLTCLERQELEGRDVAGGSQPKLLSLYCGSQDVRSEIIFEQLACLVLETLSHLCGGV